MLPNSLKRFDQTVKTSAKYNHFFLHTQTEIRYGPQQIATGDARTNNAAVLTANRFAMEDVSTEGGEGFYYETCL